MLTAPFILPAKRGGQRCTTDIRQAVTSFAIAIL